MEAVVAHTAVDPALDIAVTADTKDSPAAVTEDPSARDTVVDPEVDTEDP